MSRIGKQPIKIPDKAKINLENNSIHFKGPKGELSLKLPDKIVVKQKKDYLLVTVKNPKDLKQKALWGTYQRLISNQILGIIQGFSKKLNISGVGYRANVQGKKLILELGFSHKIEYKIPEKIEIKAEDNSLQIIGLDKQKVGQVAAEIRAFKKPDPYKAKGITYEGEIVHRKPGKQVATTET